MTAPLPAVALVVALAALTFGLGACADGGTASPRPGSWPPPCEACDPVLVSGTAGGAHATTTVVELSDQRALRRYVDRLTDPLAHKVLRRAGRIDVPDGYALGAAVVSVGCDVPPGVDLEVGEGPPTITPRPVPSPHRECFAPVTTVALAPVPLAVQ